MKIFVARQRKEKKEKEMQYAARRREAHLRRGRYHSALGNVAAANAHFARAEQLLFGVSGARQRARDARPHAAPRLKQLHEWYNFEEMASGMLHEALRTDQASVVHSVFGGPLWGRAIANLADVLKQTLGGWERKPNVTMARTEPDLFDVRARGPPGGEELQRLVQLSAHPSRDGYALVIDVRPLPYGGAVPEFAGGKHVLGESEHGVGKRTDYDDGDAAMES